MKDYWILVGKMIASAILLAALIFSIGLIFAFVPLYLAMAYKGRSKGSALLELVPVGLLAGLLWRLWSPAETAKYEELKQAYQDGLKKAMSQYTSPAMKSIVKK